MTADDQLKVRRYTADDQPAVLALAPRLAVGVAPWRDPEAVVAAVSGWINGYPDAEPSAAAAVFVAERSGRILGFAGVAERTHFSGELDGYLGELVVAPDAERQGVGRALVTAAEGWAGARGLRRLTLDTGAANQGARAFYRSLGYLEEDVRLSKEVLP
ncbi:GNAT family N-acetyltransferase [Microlunatus sp. GCM10028923]|uniref:GNAT family N-acetyltransferase n=1 Tax=Microlunatus sp. GCM10028923 TaxID=3273400 RepID=UPI003622A496